MSTLKIGRRAMALVTAALLAIVVLPGLAHAASADTTSPTLPYTSDYLETRVWVGTGNPFNATSSSWLWGTNPENAYKIQDTDVITATGLAASLSNTGGAINTTTSSATFQCTRNYAWECDNNMYNLSTGGVVWSVDSTDTTRVELWPNSSPDYNSADATNWL